MRFLEKIEKLPSGCWRWKGFKSKVMGYGEIYLGLPGKRTEYAHRFAYELFRGPIPAGLRIDHLCRNGWCVNPDHLEPVRQRTNFLRGVHYSARVFRSGKCKRGHLRPYADLSVHSEILRKPYCPACRRLYARNYYHRNRERIRAKMHALRLSNPERFRAYEKRKWARKKSQVVSIRT